MTKLYVGLDVGDRLTHICVVDSEGCIAWRGACATDPEVLTKTLERHAKGLCRVVLETGSLSAFLYHGLVERGVPAICICARHAKGVLSTRVNKSDVHDAEGLAQLARTGWDYGDTCNCPQFAIAARWYGLRIWLRENPVLQPLNHAMLRAGRSPAPAL